MNRSLLKVTLAFAFFVIFCAGLSAASKKTDSKSNLFVVGDSIILGGSGSNVYSEYLQQYLDKIYGADKIAVYNYSFYDLNTSQIFKLVENLLRKQKNTEFVVITAGEANFYNLGGFSDYLKDAGRYYPQNESIQESEIDSALKLNTAVAGIYNSPRAIAQKAFVKYAFSAAYMTLAGSGPRKIGGYVPKVIPSFLLLADDYEKIPVSPYFVRKYRAAWDMINGGKYKEAEELLSLMLLENPYDSNVFYALGSLYLLYGGMENEALKMFEDGILVNPFDRNNKCYKGLSIMYMSYDGEAVSEILYFVRVIKTYLGEAIPEINAVSAIDSAVYDEKIAAVSGWIISDIRKINSLCLSKGVHLIVAGYPFNAKSNELLKSAFYWSNIDFVDNSAIKPDGQLRQAYSDMAQNVAGAINRTGSKR
ncbi:MAG: hypothetical protein LBR69_05495 [Endomicrobium sp.]|jgi:tetratricopeptide (TPR) repeat protein|nr:hypothetical protein [Endomicrobium sp.]